MRWLLVCLLAMGCEPAAQAPGASRGWEAAHAISLPGATGPAFVDYIAYEPHPSRVWVPVGDTGSVDVFDIAKGTFTRVDGFDVAQRTAHDKTRTIGPSSATVGEGFVYVGNRATNAVCPVDEASLHVGTCLALQAEIDGVAYVAATKEVWVTAGDDKSIVVLDASQPELKIKATITVPGAAEGYAVDNAHGLFFTNLEDKDQTLVIDIHKKTVTATWQPGCGEKGPRGLVVDPARNLVIVACTDHLQVLDAAHDGARLGKLDGGGGIDNPDYLPAEGLIYAASGATGKLTVAGVGPRGELTKVSETATAPGARNVVTDSAGSAFVADPRGARLIAVPRIAR